MRVQDIMTSDPACCRPDSSIVEAAKLMAEKDCGALPVVDEAGAPVGVVTDRDICCRGVAEGKSGETEVSEVMSSDVLTVAPEDEISACCDRMEERQVRRAVVTDGNGKCCGMVAQADIAREADSAETAELVRDVSEPRERGGGC
jgi:CBS domain-containing protein